MSVASQLARLAERWAEASPSEQSNFKLYLPELCDALGVERPRPAGTEYEFEFPVKMVQRDGTESTNFIDLYKAGHFVLEAKDQDKEEPDSALLRKAFGQARAYVAHVLGTPPPYLMVLDVGNTLLVWDRWNGSYGGFNAARWIPLATLHERSEDVDLLQDIWENPSARDPGARAARVTREIAEKLAGLAAGLEDQGHDSEGVASFLIRCVFTMFAEDIELIPGESFQKAVEIGLEDPVEFGPVVEDLWRAMDKGERFGHTKFLHFNGHFFQDVKALSLTREDLAVLLEASRADWSSVEPSVMGTLLVRALDPVERHRLGAEFTPSEYVQRLVKPTVEEPIRERLTQVQAEVLQLLEENGKGDRKKKADEKKALASLREFHEWLRGLRFLDPACGSGNFLYVTLRLVKQIEAEVLREIENIEGHPDVQLEEVGPWQFHGIEIKPWAREIAELTLWIGHFQIWRELHGRTQPPEPVLRDAGNLECRDAVLAWDEIREDPSRSRPDPKPRIPHPVTGELVPDPEATLAFQEYIGARQAEWPEADFIVGNPPYMGLARQRVAFGDGYVEALRSAYSQVPDTADYVMYWWERAAREVIEGRTKRAGLITTNTIRQAQNRAIVTGRLEDGVSIIWAIPSHPWVDEVGAADVDISMTVLARAGGRPLLIRVDKDGGPEKRVPCEWINSDLTSHVDVPRAAGIPLRANEGVCYPGMKLHGGGFILKPEEAREILRANPKMTEVLRPFLNGRDLAQTPRGVFVIDFGFLNEEEAREYPPLFDIVRTRVKPQRDANKRQTYREFWWRFGEPRRELREAVGDLPRVIATPYVAKHRVFLFLDSAIVPEDGVRIVASGSPYLLGVLSSRVHEGWALATGGVLGPTPRYNHSQTFNSFPFPTPTEGLRDRIGQLASRIENHRGDSVGRGAITLTGTYNVLEKLRAAEPLTPTEREIHDLAACGVLLDMHNELDALVAEAYGWPWPMEREEILQRLVDLHDERVEEEEAGQVRWLRPDYQIPRFGKDIEAEAQELDLGREMEPVPEVELTPWPSTTIEQISVLQDLLNRHPSTMSEAASAFRGARKDQVERHLETLVLMGEAWTDPSGAYHLLGATAV